MQRSLNQKNLRELQAQLRFYISLILLRGVMSYVCDPVNQQGKDNIIFLITKHLFFTFFCQFNKLVVYCTRINKLNEMNTLKWLERKYPDSIDELKEYFDRHEIEEFKKSTLKIGRLTKDVIWCQKYKKGSIIQFRRSNPVNDYNHPFVYCILKCQVGYIESGYHSFNITENDFEEILS